MPKTSPEESKEPQEAKEPKPKADTLAPRRYVEKTAQSLIRWSPLGGTIGLLGHAVLSQDWLMAIVLFPASVVCAVWANYTEGFVEKIGEIARGRGTNDAEGLVNLGLAANEALKWQLSGFEQKYLQCQSIRCGGYETEGFNPGEFLPVTLKDVFVPLTISPNSLSELEKLGKNKLDRKALELNIWELLAGTSRQPALKQMAILAPGATAKPP